MAVELGEARRVPAAPGMRLGAGLLPAARRTRRTRRALIATLAVLAAGLATAVVVSRITLAGVPDGAGALEPAVIAQYDYAFRLPAGWRHTGGLPEHRRTLLTPSTAADGSDLVSVEQTALGYDSAAEPERARGELTDRFRRAAATDPGLRGLTMSAVYAGRAVIAYHQVLPARGAEVDWYVLFDRDAQLSVGCQHTGPGAAEVGRACTQVVASIARRNPVRPPH